MEHKDCLQLERLTTLENHVETLESKSDKRDEQLARIENRLLNIETEIAASNAIFRSIKWVLIVLVVPVVFFFGKAIINLM